MSDVLLEALRRRFRAIEGTVQHVPDDFLHEFGDVVSALMYSRVFMPDFVEVDGSILLGLYFPDRAQEFRAAKAKGRSLAAVEASFNSIEVPYLFSNRDSTDEEDTLLANKIEEAWRARLKCLYPKREFVVATLSPEKTGSVVGVQFYEIR